MAGDDTVSELLDDSDDPDLVRMVAKRNRQKLNKLHEEIHGEGGILERLKNTEDFQKSVKRPFIAFWTIMGLALSGALVVYFQDIILGVLRGFGN